MPCPRSARKWRTRSAAAGPAASQRSRPPVRRGVADGHHAERLHVGGDGKDVAQRLVVSGEEAGGEALVDRSEQQQHERSAGVHPPERHLPRRRGDRAGLVRLVVAPDVVVRAHAHGHGHRGPGHPRVEGVGQGPGLGAWRCDGPGLVLPGHGHEAHGRALRCFADRLRICRVVLLSFNKWLHVSRRDQPDLMPQLPDLTRCAPGQASMATRHLGCMEKKESTRSLRSLLRNTTAPEALALCS